MGFFNRENINTGLLAAAAYGALKGAQETAHLNQTFDRQRDLAIMASKYPHLGRIYLEQALDYYYSLDDHPSHTGVPRMDSP